METDQNVYIFEEHPDLEDLTEAELPPGYLPSLYEFKYEEELAGSGTFVFRE